MKIRFLVFYFCSFILFNIELNAQLLTSNNVTITVNSGTQLSVKGDIQNNAGTIINNNGTIDLTGNWTHNAANNCFGSSTGTVILNGAGQSIGGTNSTLFNNLTLLGSGNKTLQVNTSVGGGGSGVLSLGTQVMNLNAKTLTVINSSTGAITNSTGYILSETPDFSSRVSWQSTAFTNVLHTVPFGNSIGEPIPVTFKALNPLFSTFVDFATYKTTANNLPLPVAPSIVTNIQSIFGIDDSPNMPDRFWLLQPSIASLAEFSFTHAASETAANGTLSLNAQRWNPILNKWELPVSGQTNPSAFSASVPPVTTNYGVFALALLASPLPIELIQFDAQLNPKNQVDLLWITATEINNDYFTVERSIDANNFEPVKELDGAGNSTQLIYYQTKDEHPYKGLSYYRLKQTDFDGNYTYSQIISIMIEQELSLIHI